MKKILYLLTISGLLFSGTGCSNGGSAAESGTRVAGEMASADVQAPAAVAETSVEIPQPTKIIKTGRMGIRVDRIESAKGQVDELLAAHQGYYAEENSNDGTRSDMTLTIRVPSARFDTFVAALESNKGTVLYKNISARDVSEEFVDIETRLENKRQYLERYRELLKRAATIEDILKVESYIRTLEEEIESAEGRLRYLDNQVNYSTLELSLSTDRAVGPARDSFGARIVRALSTGWQGFVSLLIGVLYLWPLLLAGSVVGFILRWQIERRKKQR